MASILVVEDDESSSRMLARLLNAAGHAVRTAPDGAAGLEAIRENKPDIVLLDLMMPIMNGVEVLEHVRHDDTLRELRVIVLSAIHRGWEIDRVHSLGVEACFLKGTPYFQQLLQRLAPGPVQ